MMPRKKLYKATLKGSIALYKKRKLPHPVLSAKVYMRGYNDVKRISINEKNTKTSEITMPDHDEHPAYFFLRNCEAVITKEPIQIDYDPSKKIS